MAEEAKRWCNAVCERIWRHILAQLSQASTYRGIALVITAFGIYIKPEMTEAIVTIGLFISGIIGAAFPDKMGQKKDQ